MSAVAIPTALTDAETDALRELARGRVVLEVGALLGHSTLALASVAERVVSVDPHDGYPADAPRSTLIPFFQNVHGSDDWRRVVACVGRDADVLPLLAPRSFDVAFIDLTGEEADTALAIHLVRPLLRHRACVAVHDYFHEDWPGVARACYRALGMPEKVVDTLAIYGRTWH